MWSKIILCICVSIPMLTAAILSGSATYGSAYTIDLSITVDTTQQTVDITLVGPSDRYFAIGFGGTLMTNLYSIIVSGTTPNAIKEYKLSKTSPTQSGKDLSTQMITVHSDNTDATSNTRTVSITRAQSGASADHYSFPNIAGDIDIIWATDDMASAQIAISKHGPSTKGVASITMTEVTPSPITTAPTTFDPTLTPLTQSPTKVGETLYPSKYPTDAPTTATPTTDTPTTATPTTSSPTSVPSNMPSSQPSQSPVTSSPTSAPLTGSPTKVGDTTYPTKGPSDAPITSAPTTLSPTKSPSDTPTTLSPTIYDGFDTCIDAQEIVSGVIVSVGRNTVDRSMIIDISGPSDQWFGVGFGALKMDGSYAVTVEGETLTVIERILGDTALMGSVITTDSYTLGELITDDDGTTRSISIIRPWNDAGNSYDFTSFMECTSSSIDMISALGSMASIDYHENRDWKTVNRSCLCDETQTSSPTEATSAPIMQTTSEKSGGCDGADFLSASGMELDAFIIDLNIDCRLETVTVNITFNAYNNGWFGIVFSDVMIGNALIWTTNNADNGESVRSLSLYPYSITDRRSDMVKYDGIEWDWSELSRVIDDSLIFISYYTSLDSTKIFSLETQSIKIRWAKGDGSSFVLSQHSMTDRSSDTLDVDLLTGSVSVNVDNIALEIVHGAIMFLCWGCLASIGIMSSAFRYLYPKGPRWFKVHRAVQYTVFGLNLVGFMIAVIFTAIKGKPHFANKHMVMGLVVVILATLQPINAYFRPHNPDASKGEVKSLSRLIWELLHKSFGYLAWICGWITIMFGLWLLNQTVLAYLHLFLWCGLLVIIYIVLTMLKYINLKRDKEIQDANEKEPDGTKRVLTNSVAN